MLRHLFDAKASRVVGRFELDRNVEDAVTFGGDAFDEMLRALDAKLVVDDAEPHEIAPKGRLDRRVRKERTVAIGEVDRRAARHMPRRSGAAVQQLLQRGRLLSECVEAVRQYCLALR